MDENEPIVTTQGFDKRLQSALLKYTDFHKKLMQEQEFVNWFHLHFYGFKKAYILVGKRLDRKIDKFLIINDQTDTLRKCDIMMHSKKVCNIRRDLWELTEKQTLFFENTLVGKQRNITVYQRFSDSSQLLADAVQIRYRKDPEATPEELQRTEIPDFLWEVNNLYPHSKQTMDEYNSLVFSENLEKLTKEFCDVIGISKEEYDMKDSDDEMDAAALESFESLQF